MFEEMRWIFLTYNDDNTDQDNDFLTYNDDNTDQDPPHLKI